jgi:hypothetical protein
MHIASSYPYYCAEARQRMYSYYPPYSGGYATPWLWYDGDQHGAYQYSTWQSKIATRMAQDAPVTITMWGDYTQTDGTGTINVQYRNDSTATLIGNAVIVITEDSLYYAGPNGDVWHNHVARDYIPSQIGQSVTIAAGDSTTISYPFTIQSGWNENKCDILAWINDTQYQSDSTREVWQGGIKHVMDLIGIEEHESEVASLENIVVAPNPCEQRTSFLFELPVNTQYWIDVYDVSGRHVKSLAGNTKKLREMFSWDLTNDQGTRLSSGVYLYQFKSDVLSTSGKIIVR